MPPEIPAAFLCRKSPSGLSASFLQSAACIICLPSADKFHTCSLGSILSQVHALTQNIFNYVFANAKILRSFFLQSEAAGNSGGLFFCSVYSILKKT